MLSSVLGRGLSSRLFHRIRNELGMAYYIHSVVGTRTDHGEFIISLGVGVSRAKEAIKEILKEVKKIPEENVPEAELNRSKELAVGLMNLHLEASDDLAYYYGIKNTLGLELKTPVDIAKEIRGVKAGDVKRVARHVFQNKNMNLAIVGPFKSTKPFQKVFRI